MKTSTTCVPASCALLHKLCEIHVPGAVFINDVEKVSQVLLLDFDDVYKLSELGPVLAAIYELAKVEVPAVVSVQLETELGKLRFAL